MTIPDNIERHHILRALETMKEQGSSSYNQSVKFDVFYEGDHYPPKEVIREANWLANGYELRKFGGGDESNNFLIRHGLVVVLKGTTKAIVYNYTKKLAEGRREEELTVEASVVQETSQEQEDEPSQIAAEIEDLINITGIDNMKELSETETEQIVKSRIGQSEFKKNLLKRECICALCGVNNPTFLIASHIKPWRASTNRERLDINNGLLLCPNHDALFDKGYLSIDPEGRVILSNLLDEQTKVFLNVNNEMRILLSKRQRAYMDYHRENIFLI